jgi:hypothetical protein
MPGDPMQRIVAEMQGTGDTGQDHVEDVLGLFGDPDLHAFGDLLARHGTAQLLAVNMSRIGQEACAQIGVLQGLEDEIGIEARALKGGIGLAQSPDLPKRLGTAVPGSPNGAETPGLLASTWRGASPCVVGLKATLLLCSAP